MSPVSEGIESWCFAPSSPAIARCSPKRGKEWLEREIQLSGAALAIASAQHDSLCPQSCLSGDVISALRAQSAHGQH